jgi:hypothetical protein
MRLDFLGFPAYPSSSLCSSLTFLSKYLSYFLGLGLTGSLDGRAFSVRTLSSLRLCFLWPSGFDGGLDPGPKPSVSRVSTKVFLNQELIRICVSRHEKEAKGLGDASGAQVAGDCHATVLRSDKCCFVSHRGFVFVEHCCMRRG